MPDRPRVGARKTDDTALLSLASLLDLTDDDLDLPLPPAGAGHPAWPAPDAAAESRISVQADLAALARDGIVVADDTAKPADLSQHTNDTSSQTSDPVVTSVTVGGPGQEPFVVTGTVSDAPLSPAVVTASPRPATPSRPLAIAAKPVKPPKKRPDIPVANFEKTDAGSSVLWPRRPTPASLGAGAPECARCRAPFIDGRCTACGHHTPHKTRIQEQTRGQKFLAFFLHSQSRVLRTLGALLFAPGLLTNEYLGGHRRRYFNPFVVAGVAFALFAAISMFTGLRARPDRILHIGDDRTEELAAGMVGGTAVGSQVTDLSRDALELTLRTLNMLPPLWLPVMMCAVIAVIAALRITLRREGPAEMVYTAHFSAFFVLWWAIAVPLVLLAIRYGFELSAWLNNVRAIRYLDDGQIAGLSPAWMHLRARVATPLFHSILLLLGLLPYSMLAYRRGLDESWPRSIVAGFAVAVIPVVLLSPYA